MSVARTPGELPIEAGGRGALARLGALIERARERVRAGLSPGRDLVRVVVAADGLAPRAVLAAAADDSFVWEPPSGLALGGLGRSVLLQGSGDDRWLEVRDAAERVAARLDTICDPEVEPPPALFVGGGAFRPEGARRARWTGFGDASFVLPRWLVRVDQAAGVGTLELVLSPAELVATAAESLLDEAERLLEPDPAPRRRDAHPGAGHGAAGHGVAGHGVAGQNHGAVAPAVAAGRSAVPGPSSAVASWREPERERERWSRATLGILDAIGRGEVRKAVAARWLDVRLPQPSPSEAPAVGLAARDAPDAPDAPDAEVLDRVLGGFERDGDQCVRFVVQRGGRAFLGATPEMLLEVAGRTVRTHALAGTERNDGMPERSAVGSGPRAASAEDLPSPIEAERRLLARDKDRREHQLVVEHIVDRLAPLCARLEVAGEPRVKRLRHLLHLETPIAGILDAPRHVLELAAALHPTPAVAGVPLEPSLALLSTLESGERGWYAGPVGWFDERGDGAIAVALRSMLVGRDSARLFAGAGIVADSQPMLELEETRWKLAGAWRALTAAVGGELEIEGGDGGGDPSPDREPDSASD